MRGASLGIALLLAVPCVASAATFESLDGTVVFDADIGVVVVRTADRAAIFGLQRPPEPFTLAGQRFGVLCRAGRIERAIEIEGAVPEPARSFQLGASAARDLPPIDLPECRLTRTSLLGDSSGSFPQSSLEQIGLVPARSTPLAQVTRRWGGTGEGARITLRGATLSIDARGSTSASWAEEVFGGTAFVAVCDVGARRLVARFPVGIGPSRRAAAALRAAPQPSSARRGRCRLGHPFKLLNERRESVVGNVVRATLTVRRA